MKGIAITSDVMPVLAGCDFCMANESFFHSDRTLDFYVMIYVVSGCIYVTEGESDYEVHEGEVLFLQRGMRHYGKREIEKGTSWYFAHFYLDDFEQELPHVTENRIPAHSEPFRFRMEIPKLVKEFDQRKVAKQIAELADSLHAGNAMTNLTSGVTEYHVSDPLALWNANIKLFSILTELAVGGLPPAKEFSLADRIAEYLSSHTVDNFSASVLEQQFFLSYKHMAAVFKKEKQMTLQQYHRRARIADACRLLRTTMKTVGEISEELGYRDMLYFSRCFHQTVGMSPTQYRRQQTLNY